MNQSLVFDLDGTLITCENKQKYVLHSLLSSFGNVDPDKIDYWWKLKRDGYNTEESLLEIGISNAKFLSDQWINTIENFSWCYLDRPYKDTISSLKYLKDNHKLNIIILTARKASIIVLQTLSFFGINDFIDELIVVNPDKVIEGKIFYLRKIKPVLYIGDSESDYYASVDSGIRFVALTRGQRSYNFLLKKGVKQIANDLKFLKNDDSISRSKKDQ